MLWNTVCASGLRFVNFHASTFAVGNPLLPNLLMAASRLASSQANPAPGSSDLAAANCRMYGSIDAISTLMTNPRGCQSCGSRLDQVGVSLGLQLESELLAAGFDDAARSQDMHLVRHDIVQQALVVRDQQRGAPGAPQRVDTLGHDLERVDVEAGIGLVEDGKARIEHPHLKDLVALLLAA